MARLAGHSLKTGDAGRPAQMPKVAANQAWFEFQPARIAKPGGGELDRFSPPKVVNAPVERFDEHGIGQEPNNLAAIDSLHIYRRLRFGRNVDLVLTDQRSFQTECALDTAASDPFGSRDYPYLVPEEVKEIFDAGRDYADGKPPATIRFGTQQIANPRKDSAAAQHARHDAEAMVPAAAEELDRDLEDLGQLARHARLAHRSAESSARRRGEPVARRRLRTVRRRRLDWLPDRARGDLRLRAPAAHRRLRDRRRRSSFVLGRRAAKALPPRAFEPVGVEFITGSVSAPAMAEGAEHNMPKDHPLSSLFVHKPAPDAPYQRTVNMLLLHGVRSCLEFIKTGDYERAVKLSNREMSPHLQFLDLGGHGYASVSAMDDALEVEFMCIPRPVERSTTRTAARSRTESCIGRSCGKAAKHRSWSEYCSKAKCRSRSEESG